MTSRSSAALLAGSPPRLPTPSRLSLRLTLPPSLPLPNITPHPAHRVDPPWSPPKHPAAQRPKLPWEDTPGHGKRAKPRRARCLHIVGRIPHVYSIGSPDPHDFQTVLKRLGVRLVPLRILHAHHC